MTVRMVIDLNVFTGGWRPIPGYEEQQAQRLLTRTRLSSADGPVAVGDKVHGVEPEDGVMVDAVVVDVHDELGFAYLALDRATFRDDPDAGEDPACE